MKKILPIIIIAVLLFTIGSCAYVVSNDYTTRYPLTTVISEINQQTDTVTCEDSAGNLWQFKGCEDWKTGDIASLLMNDCGTTYIDDDVIEMIRYGGYFGKEW